MDSVQCNGSETRLLDCTFDEHTTACDHSHDIAVCCHDVCSVHGDLRLVGGNVPSEGRVEVCVNGVWGTVKDCFNRLCITYCGSEALYSDYHKGNIMRSVCRQLGYHSGE